MFDEEKFEAEANTNYSAEKERETTAATAAKAVRHIDDGSTRSISSKKKHRDALADDIAAFLSKGGEVKKIDSKVRSKSVTDKENNYGSRPI